MNRPQHSRTNRSRRSANKRPVAVDIWRDPGPLPDIEAITVPADVSALIRSLGEPPMLDGTAASHYFSTVVERAAAIAAALALSADLLAEQPDD